MIHEWQELTRLSQGDDLIIERVHLKKRGVALEGKFELPQLARLTMEDQTFIMAFIKSHGSIKEMERLFGISYPTVKNRLNRIAESFEFVHAVSPASARDIIEQLDRGEISVDTAEMRLKGDT